ncbi:MAG: ArsR family transcriptional regulator [Candidatus Poribacteria bacterium]|nr:ArsR family transcriptional regulator [Candidatus Poribacteria bacterium]
MPSLAQTFKVLATPSRVKIIYALSVRELCVCDLAQVVGMTAAQWECCQPGACISDEIRRRATLCVRVRRRG